MKWYFAINERGLRRYGQMIAVACRTARLNTTLRPYLLYDGKNNAFLEYLRDEGVTVVPTSVSFLPDLLSSKAGGGFDAEVARGAYLRLQVAEVEKEDRYVLYTDVDVIFRQEIELDKLSPDLFAASPEVWTGGEKPSYVQSVFNSGVMVLNVDSFREKRDLLVDFAKARGFYFHGVAGYYDQGALNQFFPVGWDKLDQRYNCRPFIGDADQAVIVHFHGTKPYEIELLLAGRTNEVPSTAKKLYGWAPATYQDLLQIYNGYVPEWWWEYLARVSNGDIFGTARST